MTFRKWIEESWMALKDAYQKIGGIEIRRVVALLVVFFAIYYVIEGFGRTVLTEFRIPQELKNSLAGVDGNTLTQQLAVELQSIRAIQETARNLKVNLVRGHESFNLRGDPLEINLSGRINTDYKSIIESVGTLEWGPLEIPIALLLRPFQKVIRQKVVQLSLQRLGNSYHVSAISDSGGVWQVTEQDAAIMDTSGNTSSDTICNLIRALACKMASLDGIGYQPEDIWIAFYHLHQGNRHLLDYYGTGGLSKKESIATLEKAAEEFKNAIKFNLKDDKSRYNLILTSFELSFYMKGVDKIDFYQSLLQKIKDLHQRHTSSQSSLGNLFIVNYVLLAEAYFERNDYLEAIRHYRTALRLLISNSDLRAYIHNNIGVAHRELGELEAAIEDFRESLEYNPSYARAHLNLGNSLIAMGEFADGERYYAIAIQKRPGYVNTFLNLGLLYLNLREHEAFEQLDQGVRTCLQVQALVALKEYVSVLEGEEITRDLSKDEKSRLERAKFLMKLVGTPSTNTEVIPKFPPYGRCLERADFPRKLWPQRR